MSTAIIPATGNKKLPAIILFTVAIVVLVSVWPRIIEKNAGPAFYINWLSHGTALVNIFCAVLYLIASVTWLRSKELSDRFHFYRGAATVFMITTLLVYPFFLMSRPYFHNGIFEWRDFVLHWADPMFMICWWLIFPPARPISAVRSLRWWIPGTVYLLYVFIRGAIVNWYPYSVLYPDEHNGWRRVILVTVLACVAFVLLAQLVAWTTRVNRSYKNV